MLVALALLAAGALVVRGAGQVLPEQLAMFPALALSIGLPGAAVLRVAGLDERLLPATALGAAPVLGLAAWVPLLLVALVAGLPLAVALWTLLAASAVALALAGPPRIPLGREALGVALAGLGTAVLAARWAKPVLESDALFHAGRVRKLVDLHELSFGGLSAYQDGHVHAGYAFPIVHAAEAGAVELAGVDPSVGFLALVPACAFLVPAAVYAAGRILGGMPAGIAVVGFVVWDAISSSGGVLDSSEQPGGIVFRVVVPVCIALIVEVVRLDDEPRMEGALVAAVLVAVLAHPTYVMPVLAMITAAVIARRGRGWRAMTGAYAVSAVTLGAIWFAAIRGTGGAAGTRLDPGGFALLGGHPVIRDGDIVIEGRLAVLLGLLAIPIVVAAWRGTHTLAGAVGAGALAVLCLPGLPALLAPLIGPHQVGRLRGAVPWPELLALLLVLLAATWPGRVWWIAAGLAAASLGVAWMGDGAAIAQTALIAGIAVAGVVLVILRVASGRPATFAVPPVVPVLPVVVMAIAVVVGSVCTDGRATLFTFQHGTPADARHRPSSGLIDFMRRHDGPPFPVVLAPLANGRGNDFTGLAFNLVGQASVDAVSLPAARTRAEPGNDPAQRRSDTHAFFDPSTPPGRQREILDRYDVRYVVVDEPLTTRAAEAAAHAPGLTQVYADRTGRDRFVVYQVNR